jgi:HEPN domain-containing protein
VEYWLNSADEDVTTVKCLLNGKRLLPATFFCHLIAEKALKAAVEDFTEKSPPKIHKLKKLAVIGNLYDSLSKEHLDLFDELEPFQIEARYSEYKDQVSKTLDYQKCKQIFKETEGFLCWIKKKLGKSPKNIPKKSEEY